MKPKQYRVIGDAYNQHMSFEEAMKLDELTHRHRIKVDKLYKAQSKNGAIDSAHAEFKGFCLESITLSA